MIVIEAETLEKLSVKAKESKRKRINLNYHSGESDLLQRLLNAMEPSTYVRPHKHENPDKREVFIILQGSIAAVIFDDDGKITDYSIMKREKGVFCVEVPPKTWHTLISLEENSVMYEFKDGPYDVITDKQFADWAPDENSCKAMEYLDKIKSAVCNWQLIKKEK